jgi:phospholipase C
LKKRKDSEDIVRLIEKTYRFVFRGLLKAVNPIKKRIVRTECAVHKFINNQAIIIIKNDGRLEAYEFLSPYINDINAGVVWADQDLKSSNHFFNPHRNLGLYGSSNAKILCYLYYKRALKEYCRGNNRKAMFYLGAACHLIQDLTVPQHANIRLLDNHRSFERWVINTYLHHDEFRISERGIYLKTLRSYIYLNSKKAISTYEKYSNLRNRQAKFYKIASIVLKLAQRTTAGLMFKFSDDIQKKWFKLHK